MYFYWVHSPLKLLVMKNLLLILSLILSVINAYCQDKYITRGFQPGEIYMTSIWYEPVYGVERYDALFYSSDNGETIGIKYVCEVYSSQGMQVDDIVSGAQQGILYNYYYNQLSISYDYGYTWNALDPPGNQSNTFLCGSQEGVIYMLWSDGDKSYLRLHRSIDFGNEFILVNDNPGGGIGDVGADTNEIYLINPPSTGNPIRVRYSDNGGVNFNIQSTLDSTIGGDVIYGHYPAISRGNSPGELYLVTWHYPDIFQIYYSTDYGQNFEQRYISGSCNLFLRYCFTAGVEPGSFYIKYIIPLIDGVNTVMHILYSSDTAKTFTEYVHFLDANFPVSVQEQPDNAQRVSILQCYPNPAQDYFNITLICKKEMVLNAEIYDFTGKLVYRVESMHYTEGENNLELQVSTLPNGIYNCVMKTNEGTKMVKKIIKL